MPTHNVTLVFEDGRVAKFAADENDTIYFAALKNRIRILTDCLEGACATCKGTCTQGSYHLEEHTDEALSQDEYDRGEVLTCRMHPTSDCVIEYAYPSKLAVRSKPDARKATVSEVEMVSSSVARLAVSLADGAPFSFMPGQYVHLSVPGTSEHRSYSFANPPFETGTLTFFVKILEQGAMSDYISQRAKPGDEMTVTGVFGKFYLRPPVRPIVMVAGGTGLAPMLSMLETMVAEDLNDQPIHLLYGANTVDELFALDRLRAYGEQGLDLTTELCVVEPSGDWDGPTGHVTSLLRADHTNNGDCEVYLCGPPPMIEAAELWLDGNGVPAAQVHAEKFVPS